MIGEALDKVRHVEPGFMTTSDKAASLTELSVIADRVAELQMRVLVTADDTLRNASAAMAEAAAASSHGGAAQIAYDRLLPYRDRIAITSVTATGPVAHHAPHAA